MARRSERARLQDIEWGWSGATGGAFASDWREGPMQPRIRRAFVRVLLAMPPRYFRRFIEEFRPQLVCQPGADGTVFCYDVAAPANPEPHQIRIYVIYLAPQVRTWRTGRIESLVAHESAHLLLGHLPLSANHGEIHQEEAAERLAESWGFKGSYSPKARRGFQRDHARKAR